MLQALDIDTSDEAPEYQGSNIQTYKRKKWMYQMTSLMGLK